MKFFHSEGAKEAGISPNTVKEYDNASRGMNLKERFTKLKKRLMKPPSETPPTI